MSRSLGVLSFPGAATVRAGCPVTRLELDKLTPPFLLPPLLLETVDSPQLSNHSVKQLDLPQAGLINLLTTLGAALLGLDPRLHTARAEDVPFEASAHRCELEGVATDCRSIGNRQ